MRKIIGLFLVIAFTWGSYAFANHYLIPEPVSVVSIMTPPPVPISSLEEATASSALAQADPTPFPTVNYSVAIDTDATSSMAGYTPEVAEKLSAAGFHGDITNIFEGSADQELTEVILAEGTKEVAFDLIVQALGSEFNVVRKEGTDTGGDFDIRILLGKKKQGS